MPSFFLLSLLQIPSLCLCLSLCFSVSLLCAVLELSYLWLPSWGARWSASKMVICLCLLMCRIVSVQTELNSGCLLWACPSTFATATAPCPAPSPRLMMWSGLRRGSSYVCVGHFFSWSVQARNYLTLNVGIGFCVSSFFFVLHILLPLGHRLFPNLISTPTNSQIL